MCWNLNQLKFLISMFYLSFPSFVLYIDIYYELWWRHEKSMMCSNSSFHALNTNWITNEFIIMTRSISVRCEWFSPHSNWVVWCFFSRIWRYRKMKISASISTCSWNTHFYFLSKSILREEFDESYRYIDVIC